MPDYKELYYKLYRDVEKTIRNLITAQQEAELRFLQAENNTQEENDSVTQE